ncbi:MAG: energy-coupling factor transporter transmembrane protein EcfT [Clostridia bacterium]|nr:energy-coupling factor transporter transmembrane protein EcfT [Clostridia bacterium]
MRKIERQNPISVFLYFLLSAFLTAFGTDIVISFISLLGFGLLYILKDENRGKKRHIFILILFLVSAFINPVTNHRGVTALFVVNDNPITLEAFLYGVCMAGTICSVIYLFSSFSLIMTSDKLIYVFGIISPKIALLLSMALRYIPLFIRQYKRVKMSQKAMGLFKDGNIVDRFRGNVRVFSIMVTWALENGIITADSMAARGYSEKRRTPFSFYRFTKSDFVFLSVSLVLFGIVSAGKIAGIIGTAFYPEFVPAGLNIKSIMVYICFSVMAFMPSIIEAKEELKWKYLTSKI